jgi:DNA-binding SARP family transcriptional activator
MQFRLLGQLEVVDRGHPVEIGGGKRRMLLALLLLNANKVVSSDQLVDELWGESPPATAAKSLQVSVSRLRKDLRRNGAVQGAELLVTRGSGYALCVESGDLDVEAFERALVEGERWLTAGRAQRAAERLREALDLWRGPALADFAYEPFAQLEIGRLEELRLTALEARIDAELALGEHARLVGELEVLSAEHPHRERFCAQLMNALYRGGRQAEALAAYRQAERTLREQLGIEPSPPLRELEARILAQDPGLLPAPVLPEVSASALLAVEHSSAESATRQRALPLRGPVLLAVAALLVGGAALLIILRQSDEPERFAGPDLDAATNSLVALDATNHRPERAVPLPGRPTGLATAENSLLIPTVDSAALTAVNIRRGSISRTVPLRGEPDGVAVGEGGVWVTIGARGLLVRIEPGYEDVSLRARYPRARRPPDWAGRLRVPRSAVAAGAGSVWVTNGSRSLSRVDPVSGRVSGVRLPLAGNDVAIGAGGVWVMSARRATVMRVDPERDAVSDRITLAGRPGGNAPFPIGIAATTEAVWVLNGNTATITEIDPVSRALVRNLELGVERVPNDIAAAGRTAWVANSDGTLSRVDAGAVSARSIWVGESLQEVATDGRRVWATTTALDQRLPGGAE